jgi:hypothetical protein
MAARRFGLFVMVAGTIGIAAADETIQYKSADYTFSVDAAEKNIRVTWSYPVFLSGFPSVTGPLNAWVRDQSLEPLAECAGVPLANLRTMRDSEVIRTLKAGRHFADCDYLDQSDVSPSEAFGTTISITKTTEWSGLTRSQHGEKTLYFDLSRNAEIGIETFFRTDALAALNEALASKIHKERPNCSGRSFDWSQVSFRPPNMIFMEFPYNPAEWNVCGDGVEMLKGKVVKDNLVAKLGQGSAKKIVRIP